MALRLIFMREDNCGGSYYGNYFIRRDMEKGKPPIEGAIPVDLPVTEKRKVNRKSKRETTLVLDSQGKPTYDDNGVITETEFIDLGPDYPEGWLELGTAHAAIRNSEGTLILRDVIKELWMVELKDWDETYKFFQDHYVSKLTSDTDDLQTGTLHDDHIYLAWVLY
jgi:hypothetical protein